MESLREVRTGSLVIDRAARRVIGQRGPIPLSNTEYRLLDALASRMGELIPHDALLREVWGPEYVNDVQYLRVYVGYLRKKLEKDASNPEYLQSEWGVGYRLMRLPLISAHSSECDEDDRTEPLAAPEPKPTAA